MTLSASQAPALSRSKVGLCKVELSPGVLIGLLVLNQVLGSDGPTRTYLAVAFVQVAHLTNVGLSSAHLRLHGGHFFRTGLQF